MSHKREDTRPRPPQHAHGGHPAPRLARCAADPDEGVWGPPPPYRPPTPHARAALAEVYARLHAALDPLAGTCRACGRCCRFQEGGIVLFASALEMAHLVAARGMPRAGTFVTEGPVNSAWCCPYQEGNACTARVVRPLGCRTYFCDGDAAPKGRARHADALDRLRCIARDHAYPWWYGPARVCLAAWT